MDNAGWHAHRRAQKEDELYRQSAANFPHYAPPVEDVAPMEESFIGGFRHQQQPSSPRPPPLPPKDYPPYHQHGAQVSSSLPVPGPPTISTSQLTHMSAIERSKTQRVARMDPHLQFMCGPLLKYDTIDEHGIWRGAALIVTADSGSIYAPHPTLTYSWDPDVPVPDFTFSSPNRRPSPHPNPGLGPSATPTPSGSGFSSYPGSPGLITRETTNNSTYSTHSQPQSGYQQHLSNTFAPTHASRPSFELGPHPADPHSTLPASPMVGSFAAANYAFNPTSTSSGYDGMPNGGGENGYHYGGAGHASAPGGSGLPDDNAGLGPNAFSEQALGQELWVYGGHGGTFTFWRFLLQIPLGNHEMNIKYSINHGQQLEFWVPGQTQNMRWAAHSCNGFSAGINPDDFRGPGFKSGYDPVWMDLLSKHSETPFHALVGGGDQLYCDSLMREPEMQEWVSQMKPEEKKRCPLSREMELAIDRFFFSHYCQVFRTGAFARANCSIPMLNMCDDHDIIDGFGSYPDDLQRAPVFRQIGIRGYFFFLLFQCFINVEQDGVSDLPGKHVYQSLVLGSPGPYVSIPSHSFLPRLGPQVYMLLLDCRAERRKEQVCSPFQYTRVFDRLNNLPAGVEHVIVQLGIPIAYPRMNFLENALESKYNPLVALGRNGSMGLSGFVNKFNADAELLDDLNDHWTARSHKKERNWLIEQLQNFARVKRIRVSFLSGDVHCAAVGVLKTLAPKGKGKQNEIVPIKDWRYMVNVVTSAIVNTPPPNGVITMVSSLATKVHKTLHGIETDETMIPLFTTEPNTGQPRKQKFIMGKRNWCRVEWDGRTGELEFDIKVEREKGNGVTASYPLRVPPPGWQ